MIVYTAAKLRDLDPADARKVALFIRTATSEGQKAGAGNGELPRGFLPIQKTGPTRKLYDLAAGRGRRRREADPAADRGAVALGHREPDAAARPRAGQRGR